MKSKILTRAGACLLALLLLLSLCPLVTASAFAEESQELVVEPDRTGLSGLQEDGSYCISTAADLQAFSALCRSDTWSTGRTVYLTADLSLAGITWEPVPSFSGVFEGGGHRISDLSIRSAASPAGLFARIGRGGEVHSLNVSGECTPAGNADYIGGIVGQNNGLIADCTFTGTVTGSSMVGGIAGVNHSYGCIELCSSSGSVTGGSMTGGIAGANYGSIFSCRNESYVNITEADPTINLNEIDLLTMLESFTISSTDTLGITEDSGGIAGYSSGIIGLCTNNAVIGYQHIGYNAGGIVGRSCGYVYSCSNSGGIFGRKDIGGIVGQQEPYSNILSQTDLLGNLSGQLSGLSYVLNRTISDTTQMGENAAAHLEELALELAPVSQAVMNVDLDDPDTLLYALDAIGDVLGSMSSNFDDLSYRMDAVADVMSEDMTGINNQLSGISNATTDILSAITNANAASLMQDTSTQDIDTITYGKTARCENSGSVAGDLNIGGIAGQMSVESDMNPEDDLELTLSTVRTEYEYKAVLSECVNLGSVTSRKDCAGCVVGKVALGCVSSCQGYGSAASETGDYVGGIAGLNYSVIQDCWAKCELQGSRRIGGIVGSGQEDSGCEVNRCRALVNISGDTQFIGAIAGCDEGLFLDNYFVSDSLQGINGQNLAGQAEPMDYSDFIQLEGMPNRFRSFTLRFSVDDEVIHALVFFYGDNPDPSTFPAVPAKAGYFGSWESVDLSSLHADTTLHAVYTKCSTTLSSNLLRTDGRSALYVDGQFTEGDLFTVSVIPADLDTTASLHLPWYSQLKEQLSDRFHGREVDPTVCSDLVECLQLTIPTDGSATHTVRYTLPENYSGESCRIYVDTGSGFRKADVEMIGSYSCFEVEGTQARLYIFTTVHTVLLLIISLAVLLVLCLLVILLIRSIRKQFLRKQALRLAGKITERAENLPKERRKTILVSVVTGAVLLGLLGVGVFYSPLGQRLSMLSDLKKLLKQAPDAYEMQLDGNLGSSDFSINCVVEPLTLGSTEVQCIDLGSTTLYYADGILRLPNGTGYQLEASLPDTTSALQEVKTLLLNDRINCSSESSLTTYSVEADKSEVSSLITTILPELGGSKNAFEVTDFSMTLLANGSAFQSLEMETTGETHAGMSFSIRIRLTAAQGGRSVPDAVVQAIRDGSAPVGSLSLQTLDLAAAWLRLGSADAVHGTLELQADCGSLLVNDSLTYDRQLVDGHAINCLSKNELAVYFDDAGTLCRSNGKALTSQEDTLAGASLLPELLKTVCFNSTVRTGTEGENRVFSLTVDSGTIEALCHAIAPASEKLDVRYESGTVTAVVHDGEVIELRVVCTGSLKVVLKELSVSFSACLQLDDSVSPSGSIPQAVLNTLIIPEA